MSRTVQALLLAAIVVATLIGFGALYRLRIVRGDIYPEYSSFRADPLGSRVFHDSLAQIPGFQVSRNLAVLNRLRAEPQRTILLAGVSPGEWKGFTTGETDPLNAAAKAGSRVVIALRPRAQSFIPERERKTTGDRKTVEERKTEGGPASGEPSARQAAQKSEEDKRKAEEKERREARGRALGLLPADLVKLWGVKVVEGKAGNLDLGARRAVDVPRALPLSLRWESDLHFTLEPDLGWRVLYRRAGEAVLAERPLGRGTLVVAADSYFLSNESLQMTPEPELLSWVAGANRAIEFDESHLGIVQEHGIAALARRYGLTSAVGTLMLLAGLFVWRRMALFVPPAPELPDLILSHSPTAGLEALLRRAVRPGELMATCVREWQRTARQADAARVDAATAAMAGPGGVSAYNRAVRALRRR